MDNTKKRIYIELNEHEAKEFKKRCIDYDESMSDVIRPCIKDFMKTHPPKINRRPNIE